MAYRGDPIAEALDKIAIALWLLAMASSTSFLAIFLMTPLDAGKMNDEND